MSMTGKLKGLLKASFFSTQGALLFLATTVVNAASLVFHLVVSRQLDPAAYGALGALVVILAIFAVPAAALQVAVTREVAARRSDLKEKGPLPIVVGPLLTQAILFGTITTTLLVLVSPLIKNFLALPSLTSAVLLAVYLLPTSIELVPRAVLLGEMRFGRVAIAMTLGALVRVALSYPLSASRGVDGAMAATVLGALVSPAILLPSLRSFIHERDGARPLRLHWRDVGGAITAFLGFWVLASIDTIMARHVLSNVKSGYYAAASVASRSVLFLPGAVATIVFPRFASGGGRNLEARRTLVHALAFVSALGVLAAVGLMVFSGPVMSLLFPTAYQPSTAALGVLAFASAAMGTMGIVMHYHFATRARVAASLPWVAVVLIIVGASIVNGSLVQLAVVTLVANLSVLVLMTWPIFASGPAPHAQYFGRELWDLPEATIDLTMVVPFYNPGPRLKGHIERLVEVLEQSASSFEVIAVSDGSTDKSDLELEGLDDRVKVVRLARNSGKGQALRTGLAMGRGRYIGFIDADGDVAPDPLHAFLALVRLYQPDVILGSKRHPMSEVHYPFIRRVYSWGYQQLVRVLFRLNLRDTQTGLKLVRREALAPILARMVEKRFAFDLELFVVGRHLGFKNYFEAPVNIEHHFTSTVSWRSVRGTLIDTLAIFYRLHVLRFYDIPDNEKPQVGNNPR